VASFAFGQRHAVLDTNVRRVLARLVRGAELPPRGASVAEVRLAEALLPTAPRRAARWSVAVMELGALVCTAARPDCAACPVARQCAWQRAGRPPAAARPVSQRYAGTDRECRGRLLAVLRESAEPVPAERLEAAWPDREQQARALSALVADGLAATADHQMYALPGDVTALE
jgi:A/G-specific adenine glycosylase